MQVQAHTGQQFNDFQAHQIGGKSVVMGQAGDGEHLRHAVLAQREGGTRFVCRQGLRLCGQLPLRRSQAFVVVLGQGGVKGRAQMALHRCHFVLGRLGLSQRGKALVAACVASQGNGHAHPRDLLGASAVTRTEDAHRGVGPTVAVDALGLQMQALRVDAQHVELVVGLQKCRLKLGGVV